MKKKFCYTSPFSFLICFSSSLQGLVLDFAILSPQIGGNIAFWVLNLLNQEIVCDRFGSHNVKV